MSTVPPAVSSPPTVPDRANPITFPALMKAAFDYLFGNFYSGMVALAASAYDNANVADGAAATAVAATGVVKWVSGTSYADGAVVWSPASYHTYRRKGAGAGTTDPASDRVNWRPLTIDPYDVSVISGNTTAVAFKDYVFTAVLTLTLPSSPASGDWVGLKSLSSGTVTLAPGAEKIESAAGNWDIDIAGFGGRVVYIDATRGWCFI